MLSKSKRVLATNPRANYDYQLLEKFEAGIVLTGPEVKSIKAGRVSLKESYVKLIGQEAWLVNAFVAPYAQAGKTDMDPQRSRKLLLHRQELFKLAQKVKEKGLTLVPVSCYTKGRHIKLAIALGKGKKRFEKRQKIRERDLVREEERIIRGKE